jgi:hypothetical protein
LSLRPNQPACPPERAIVALRRARCHGICPTHEGDDSPGRLCRNCGALARLGCSWNDRRPSAAGAGMRHRRRWWAALLLVWAIVQTGTVSAADDAVHQLDLFAAYCIGVLDSLAARQKQAPANRCSSLETKIACEDRAAGIQQRISDTGYRRDRFERYLKIRAQELRTVLLDGNDQGRVRRLPSTTGSCRVPLGGQMRGSGAAALLILARSDRVECQSADQPDNEQDNQHEAQGSAQSGPAIGPIAVVATAAAKQQDQQDDDENRQHLTLLGPG